MSETPAWLREKITAYYRETTGPYYLAWAGDTLAFHVGLEDDPPSPAAAPSDSPSSAAAAPSDSASPETATPDKASPAAPGPEARSPTWRDDSLLRMNRYLADKAGIGPGMRVLDAGCGVGGSSIWLTRERGARTTGITLDPGQVELARTFAAERGAPEARFEQMDFSATTFLQGSFDVVWNIESLCHSGDARAYLRHVFDLLADGGRFACMDFFRGDKGDPAHCEAMCEGWVLPDLQSMESIAAMLSEVGFVSVEVEDVTPRVLPTADMMRAGGLFWSVLYKLDVAAGKASGPMGGKHFLAAVGAGNGLRGGSVTYGYVGATRPPRR